MRKFLARVASLGVAVGVLTWLVIHAGATAGCASQPQVGPRYLPATKAAMVFDPDPPPFLQAAPSAQPQVQSPPQPHPQPQATP
jgi:hypothetical protein